MSDLPKTVLYPTAFLRSPSAGFDGVLHWDHWQPAIARRLIRPSDIDAIVEIKGHFLICESKDAGVTESSAQTQTLDALLQTGLFTLIRRWGKEPPGKYWQYEKFNYKSAIMGPTENQTVVEQESVFISRWAESVDAFDHDRWRLRMMDAALKDAPIAMRQFLFAQLKKENREALGPFSDTPLGKSQTTDGEL